MKKSRAVKRKLLSDLWDEFIEQERVKVSEINKLCWKQELARKKAEKAAIQQQIDALPKSPLTMDKIFSLTTQDRDEYCEKYFEMRLLDYAIQTQTRFCSAQAADLGTINELQTRNILFEKKVLDLAKQLGIPMEEVDAFAQIDLQDKLVTLDTAVGQQREETKEKHTKGKKGHGAFKRQISIVEAAAAKKPNPLLVSLAKQMVKNSGLISTAKYGTYRETYDPRTQKMTLVNLIVVPSQREFEWMAVHASE